MNANVVEYTMVVIRFIRHITYIISLSEPQHVIIIDEAGSTQIAGVDTLVKELL